MNNTLIKTIIKIIIRIFKNNKKNHQSNTSNEDKWNYMIDLWVDNKLDNPIKHLITYDNEINNGGHLQFFQNNHDELSEIIPVIKKYLSKNMSKNLQDAYELYLKINPNIDSIESYVEVSQEENFEKFDNYYYEHDKEINKVLTEYSLTLKIN